MIEAASQMGTNVSGTITAPEDEGDDMTVSNRVYGDIAKRSSMPTNVSVAADNQSPEEPVLSSSSATTGEAAVHSTIWASEAVLEQP